MYFRALGVRLVVVWQKVLFLEGTIKVTTMRILTHENLIPEASIILAAQMTLMCKGTAVCLQKRTPSA